jgi:hypothetical protein
MAIPMMPPVLMPPLEEPELLLDEVLGLEAEFPLNAEAVCADPATPVGGAVISMVSMVYFETGVRNLPMPIVVGHALAGRVLLLGGTPTLDKALTVGLCLAPY